MRDKFYIIICIFCICDIFEATVFSNSLKSCQLYCIERNLAFPLGRGEYTWNQESLESCDYNCRVNSCHHGCHDLDEVQSKCDRRCVDEGVNFDSCSQGCHAVEQAFLVQVQELLYQVTVTIDVLDETLRLRWQFPDSVRAQVQEVAAADVSWYAQSRPSNEKIGWRWTPLTTTAFRNSTLSAEIHIPLDPTPNLQVGVSRAITYQMPLRILPSRLEISSQLQLSSDKIAICWQGDESMKRFKISLATLDGNSLFMESTDKRCYILESLPKENCCRATISDVTTQENTQSISIKLDMIQVTSASAAESTAMTYRLIFSTGTHIFQMRNANDYVISEEPIAIPFEIPEGDLITSLECISSNSLMIGSKRGSLWLLSLEYNSTAVYTTPTPIHSMQHAVYVVLHDKGIVRCTLDNPSCFLLTNRDSLNAARNVAVDTNNGFLYILGADHQVYRSELFPIEMVENYQLTKVLLLTDDVFEFCIHSIQNIKETENSILSLTDIPSTSAIVIDKENFQLLAVLQNGTILAKNLISGDITTKRGGEYVGVKRLAIDSDRMFWSREKCGDTPLDEMCFYSENAQKDGGDTHFSRYLYSGKIVDFAVLSDPILPPTLVPPEKIGLIMSDTTAKVSWVPPVNLPFQASGNLWRNLSYEIRLVTPDSPDSPVAMKMSNETYVLLSISPGAEYTASVRVCWRTVCSPFVNVINTAFQPLKYSPIAYLKRSNDATSTYDLLGEEMPANSISEIIQPCCDGIMALDNTTKILYSISSSEEKVVFHRVSEPGKMYVFTDFLAVKFITVLASRAILVLASSYQIISYRLTGAVEHIIFSCTKPFDDCSEIIGLSSDDSTGEIHFLAQYPNGTTALYEQNADERTTNVLATSTDLPQ
ncbi:hypothetical protein DICVIV_02313 [Dictyocaulus viviparus]|uniref:Fibronectin type III domain protein n=1 Tax=Dictyocaulus viviparus TaxID=29172 RepID=A0A0D8Y437_DICVI|nr:hypothetical protein DICVIV_02313 [Dictyocaulus viviparus]